MIKEGILDKYGRPNEKTPPDWEKKLFEKESSVKPAVSPAAQVCNLTFVKIFRHVYFESRTHDSTPCRFGPSVGRWHFWAVCENSLHYCPCPTIRDWSALYPALFNLTFEVEIADALEHSTILFYSSWKGEIRSGKITGEIWNSKRGTLNVWICPFQSLASRSEFRSWSRKRVPWDWLGEKCFVEPRMSRD